MGMAAASIISAASSSSAISGLISCSSNTRGAPQCGQGGMVGGLDNGHSIGPFKEYLHQQPQSLIWG